MWLTWKSQLNRMPLLSNTGSWHNCLKLIERRGVRQRRTASLIGTGNQFGPKSVGEGVWLLRRNLSTSILSRITARMWDTFTDLLKLQRRRMSYSMLGVAEFVNVDVHKGCSSGNHTSLISWSWHCIKGACLYPHLWVWIKSLCYSRIIIQECSRTRT